MKNWKLGGEYTDVHKILVSAAAVNERGHMTFLEAGGGFVIPNGSKVGRELQDSYRKILQKNGTSEFFFTFVGGKRRLQLLPQECENGFEEHWRLGSFIFDFKGTDGHWSGN